MDPAGERSEEQGRLGFWSEFWDAVAPRTVAMVAGVLVIQLMFIASYVGAFHAPRPHGVRIAVVAPPSLAPRYLAALNRAGGHPVSATPARSETVAADAVRSDRIAGALVVHPSSHTDTALVASGGGYALASAVQDILTTADTRQHRTVKIRDLVPLQAGDYHGLSGFYLVIGWIVGGYLMAAMLGISAGARPATTRRALIRLLSVAPYAVLSGIGGALIIDQWLGALTGHFWELAGLGVLVVYAAAATTMAFQVLAGVIGIGLTVLVFVVVGNPSAGGAYQPPLLSGFFRIASHVLPNGAAVDTVRRLVYFGAAGITIPLIVICAWIVGGTVVAVLGALRNDRRRRGAAALGTAEPDPGGRLGPAGF